MRTLIDACRRVARPGILILVGAQFLLGSGCGNETPAPPSIVVVDEVESDPARQIPPEDRRTTALETLKGIGVHVVADNEGLIESITGFRNRQLRDEHLAAIAAFEELKILDLRRTAITNEGLSQLSSLVSLEQLYLGDTRITGDGLAHLGKMTLLEVLNLEGLRVDAKAINAHLKGRLDLSRVNLARTDLNDEGLGTLSWLSNLEALVVTPGITDRGTPHLSAFPKLEVLFLDGNQITDEGLGPIEALSQLKRLSLKKTPISVAGICRLATSPVLQQVSFQHGSYSNSELVLYPTTKDDDLASVAELNRLRKLKLDHTTISDAGLAHLTNMQNLEALVLPRTITDRGLAHLAKLTGLKRLAVLGPGITGKGLRAVRGMVLLTELSLDGTRVDDEGFTHVARLERLERLSCRRTQVTDSGLVHISRLFQLRVLRLDYNDISDDGLVHLEQLEELRRLSLIKTRVNGDKLEPLEKLARLELLDFNGTRVSSTDIDRLKQSLPDCEIRSTVDPLLAELRANGNKFLPALEQIATITKTPKGQIVSVNIRQRRFSDAGLAKLTGLKQLDRLSLQDTKVSNAGLKSLLGMKRLSELWLDKTSINDQGLQQIGRLKTLRRLLIRQSPVSLLGVVKLSQTIPRIEIFFTGGRLQSGRLELDPPLVEADLASLKGAGNIRVLDLAGLRVSDSAVTLLARLPGLTSLVLKNCRITDNGVRQLAKLQRLESMDLSRTQLTDKGLAPLSNLKSLKVLKLGYLPITREGMVHIAALPNLTELHMAGTNISGNSLTQLKGLTKLRVLDLSELRITDRVLARFVLPHTQLQRLGLRGTDISGNSLKPLGSLEQLEVLWLGQTAISSNSLGRLAAYKKLRSLDLSGTPIDDSAVQHLQLLPSLRTLNLSGTLITAPAARELAKALPQCQLTHDPDPLVEAVVKAKGDVTAALKTVCQVQTDSDGAVIGLGKWSQPLTNAGLHYVGRIRASRHSLFPAQKSPAWASLNSANYQNSRSCISRKPGSGTRAWRTSP